MNNNSNINKSKGDECIVKNNKKWVLETIKETEEEHK
jgi:hypothetical protein